jgi:hypothetical protein
VIAEARRAETQVRQREAIRRWEPSKKPVWLDEATLKEKIVPRFSEIQVPALAAVLMVPEPYATAIKRGTRIPHPRHWLALASVVGISKHSDMD